MNGFTLLGILAVYGIGVFLICAGNHLHQSPPTPKRRVLHVVPPADWPNGDAA